MRSLWTSGLALTLGLLAQGAGAADDARPAVSLGAPVSLGRAMALPQGNSAGVSIADPLLRPTSYENTTDRGGIFRGASPVEVINARPMPMGPVEGQSVSIWAKAPQVAPKSDGYVGPIQDRPFPARPFRARLSSGPQALMAAMPTSRGSVATRAATPACPIAAVAIAAVTPVVATTAVALATAGTSPRNTCSGG
jgi:hypothetical protein